MRGDYGDNRMFSNSFSFSTGQFSFLKPSLNPGLCRMRSSQESMPATSSFPMHGRCLQSGPTSQNSRPRLPLAAAVGQAQSPLGQEALAPMEERGHSLSSIPFTENTQLWRSASPGGGCTNLLWDSRVKGINSDRGLS